MIYCDETVLDTMKIPVDGDSSVAVKSVINNNNSTVIECDILVVGGGMGGLAGAWAAASRGHKVCLIEETDWLGGQMTSQGVSALDEHMHIEQFGGTRRYYQLCEAIRQNYQKDSEPNTQYNLNPGNCWVSRLAFEPKVALDEINMLIAPYVQSGRLQLHLRTKAFKAEVSSDLIKNITTINLDNDKQICFHFDYVLDATELGDLLPLTGTEYSIGAESVAETNEPHAQPQTSKSHCIQSLSYVFALERRPSGQNHTIRKPRGYEHYRDTQPYTLRIHVHGGEIYGENTGWLQYELFNESPGTKGPLWHYRRLVDAKLFPNRNNDISMFNWPGIDYRDEPVVDQEPLKLSSILQEAKRVSLGFAYWLQTEVNSLNGTTGFPELLLRPDIMGSSDGLAKYPYIRECRRLKAQKTIFEQEVAIAAQKGSRAAHFYDSVGIGWYPIDIHQAGKDDVGTSTRTKPFQIPLGALIPQRVINLIAANKNIGTTHITNGCYRLHPIEWNIGEAAGILAAYANETAQTPQSIHNNVKSLKSYQSILLNEGIPLGWLIDCPLIDEPRTAMHKLFMAAPDMGDSNNLKFNPNRTINPSERAAVLKLLCNENINDPLGSKTVSRGQFAESLATLNLI